MSTHPNTTSSSPIKAWPPKVNGWPVWGSFPDFHRQGIDFLLESRATYGDIYRFDLVGTEVTVLGHPDYTQHVLRDNGRNYRSKGAGRAFRASSLLLLGDSVVATADQVLWRQQRRAIQPYFNHNYLLGLTDLMVEVMDVEMAAWDSMESKPVDMQPELTRMAIKGITKSLCGMEVTSQEAQQISQAIDDTLGYMWLGMIANTFPKGFPFPGQRGYEERIKGLDDLVLQLVKRRRQKNDDREDLMSMLLRMQRAEGEDKISLAQVRDEVVTMLVATCESLSASLGFLFHHLSQQPAIMHTLRAEVDSVLGKRSPTFADVPKLKYARMVMQEALRIAAPAYWIQRMAKEEDEIGGFHIPAGSIVVSIIHLIHHHPEIWPHPDRFEPERFLPERSKTRHKLAWIPFGTGQRLCTGQDYTLMYGQLLLAQLFQRYNLTAVPNRSAGIHLTTGLKVNDGVWVTLEKREIRD